MFFFCIWYMVTFCLTGYNKRMLEIQISECYICHQFKILKLIFDPIYDYHDFRLNGFSVCFLCEGVVRNKS